MKERISACWRTGCRLPVREGRNGGREEEKEGPLVNEVGRKGRDIRKEGKEGRVRRWERDAAFGRLVEGRDDLGW